VEYQNLGLIITYTAWPSLHR